MTVRSCNTETFTTFPAIDDQVYYVGETNTNIVITAPTMSELSCEAMLVYSMTFTDGSPISSSPFSFN